MISIGVGVDGDQQLEGECVRKGDVPVVCGSMATREVACP
jgi:hypothetical protein